MIFISNAIFKQFVNPILRTEIISSENFINPEGDSESSIAIMYFEVKQEKMKLTRINEYFKEITLEN